MLEILSPCHQLPEVRWICSVLFGEFLGLEHCIGQRAGANFCIQYEGCKLELPDIFFAKATQFWLQAASLPTVPLAKWDIADSNLNACLVNTQLPVLFGSPEIELSERQCRLGLDIFGSIFFMLSRYEEAVSTIRDNHDRFPATASLAYREGFLDRPIVDEYVEILWAAMKQVWPGLKRKARKFCMRISCDVDRPFDTSVQSLPRFIRRMGGQVLRQRRLSALVPLARNYIAASRGNLSYDPYRLAMDWIMDINELAGNQVAFYFIPENTDPLLDTDFSLKQPLMRELLRSIHARGHEIGIHPGYNTYKHLDTFTHSVQTLRRVMVEEGIEQEVLGGRQHYLRWETPTTAQLWDANRLSYDSTLSYASCPGFRCGTCHEYPLYDVLNRKPLQIRERPLIVMERAVIPDNYLGFGYTDDALGLMLYYRDICRQFLGNFTLLWHNSNLATAKERAFYRELIN